MIERLATLASQQPPWIITTTGCGPSPSGSQTSTIWLGSFP